MTEQLVYLLRLLVPFRGLKNIRVEPGRQSLYVLAQATSVWPGY